MTKATEAVRTEQAIKTDSEATLKARATWVRLYQQAHV